MHLKQRWARASCTLLTISAKVTSWGTLEQSTLSGSNWPPSGQPELGGEDKLKGCDMGGAGDVGRCGGGGGGSKRRSSKIGWTRRWRKYGGRWWGKGFPLRCSSG